MVLRSDINTTVGMLLNITGAKHVIEKQRCPYFKKGELTNTTAKSAKL